MEMLISRGNFPQFFSDEQKTAFQIPTAVQEMFNKYTNIARVLSYASLRTRIKILVHAKIDWKSETLKWKKRQKYFDIWSFCGDQKCH